LVQAPLSVALFATLHRMLIFQISRRQPQRMKALIRKGLKRLPEGYDIDTHFSPRYNPCASASVWSRTATSSPRSAGDGRRSLLMTSTRSPRPA
jgi:cation diffusion facilitator CzcD-associated flavoprotein CzcO